MSPMDVYPPTEEADARLCAEVARKHARTFSIASLLLPPDKRRAAYAIYSFCRVADDIVDTGESSRDEKRRQLDDYRLRVEAAIDGDPGDDGILRELSRAVAYYNIPEEPLQELLDGVARDLDHDRVCNWNDLEVYCSGVASSVGELCAYIFCGRDGASRVPDAIPYARHLGTAMQVTNILRDVGEDARLGRCYLPEDELISFGLTRDRVLYVPAIAGDERWRDFMVKQVARARMIYREATPGIALLASDSRRCATACATGYERILDAIEQLEYDTVSTRARLGRVARARVLWGAWLAGSAVPVPPGMFHSEASLLDVSGDALRPRC